MDVQRDEDIVLMYSAGSQRGNVSSAGGKVAYVCVLERVDEGGEISNIYSK